LLADVGKPLVPGGDAIRGLAGFVAEHSPVQIEWRAQIRSIPFEKAGRAVVPYIEKAEMDASNRARSA
jgi:hypothetical protein